MAFSTMKMSQQCLLVLFNLKAICCVVLAWAEIRIGNFLSHMAPKFSDFSKQLSRRKFVGRETTSDI